MTKGERGEGTESHPCCETWEAGREMRWMNSFIPDVMIGSATQVQRCGREGKAWDWHFSPPGRSDLGSKRLSHVKPAGKRKEQSFDPGTEPLSRLDAKVVKKNKIRGRLKDYCQYITISHTDSGLLCGNVASEPWMEVSAVVSASCRRPCCHWQRRYGIGWQERCRNFKI